MQQIVPVVTAIEIPKKVWEKSWNVNSQAVGSSEARWMIEISYGFEVIEPEREAKPKAEFICGTCGNPVRYLFSLPPKRPMVSGRSG